MPLSVPHFYWLKGILHFWQGLYYIPVRNGSSASLFELQASVLQVRTYLDNIVEEALFQKRCLFVLCSLSKVLLNMAILEANIPP